jgi:two-component system sensor histidine kinase/response regulator
MTDAPLAKILIIDDEVTQMKALCHTLRDRGYETIGLSSARMALDAIRETPFDLLLSDLMMPEMDGIALLQAATQIDPNLVGIIMTGEGTISTAVAAMKSGALDFILKPFKLGAIQPVLDRALAVRRLRLENTRLELQVRQRTAELEIANQELEAFSYSVSHDLRAPLRAMDGFSQAVLEDYGPQLPPEGQRYLQTIRQGAQRMGTLIDDLLTFSRLSRVPLNKQEVNTDKLVHTVIEDLNSERQGRQVEFRMGKLPSCQGDSALLKQVWTNLLSNAVKYTRHRNPAVIEIGCETEKENTYFVRDNGAGFDMRYVHKLFGVFQRLHRADQFEGTGVGLAIVQRVIHRHGGRVWAEAAPDRGASFYFTLQGETKP